MVIDSSQNTNRMIERWRSILDVWD